MQLVRPLYHGLQGLEAMYAIQDGYNYKGFEYPAHTDGKKFFYQCISNGIINKCDFAELIIFMPYQSQLMDITNSCMEDQQRWLQYNSNSIPFLKDGGFFKNINIIRFKIPQADKDFLTECVTRAGEYL